MSEYYNIVVLVGGAAKIITIRYDLPKDSLITLNHANCVGTEERLADCPSGSRVCYSPGAAVQCFETGI